MKQLLIFICIFSLLSCTRNNKQNSNDNYFDNPSNNDTPLLSSSENIVVDASDSKSVKLHKIKNEQFGVLFGVMPIPSSWNFVNNTKDNIMFESSNGTKIYAERYNRFFYSNDPEQNYFMEQKGTQIKAPKSIEQVIHEDFEPFLKSKGIILLNQFPLPELAKLDQQLDNALFKSVPEQKTYTCMVTEWKDKDGLKSLGILRYFKNYYTTIGGMDWGYTFNTMEAPKSVYKASKTAYINALLNLQVNPNWLKRNNQFYALQAQQSTMQHQQRMASIRAQGQAMRNTANTYSSILDSNHESWKRRNAMTDAGHSNTINSGIWERSTMQDQSGNQYQVEGNYNNVWKASNDNTYLGTDNTNWNPNIDNTTNSIDWEQLENSDDNY